MSAPVVPILSRSIVQIAYVVNDIEAAMRTWTDTFGVGPWFHNPDIRVSDPHYRGTPTDLRFAGAVTHAGDVQLELIQQLNDVPSCYRDLFPAGREGHHHIAVLTADFDADLARYAAAGFPVAFSGTHREMRFAYVDTSAVLGIMTEVLEDVPSIRAGLENTRSSSATWDGSDPVRTRPPAAR